MTPPLWRTTAISALGGVFEFYDFVIFAVFAPHIGRTFFPEAAGETASTLKAFAVFAVGYLARPVGGILWAHVADRKGRAYVFSHTVLGMAATTLLIGLLPGHATLGITATVLLVVLRLIQGMALGGEIPASLCWLSEHAGPRHAGLVTAMLLAGVNSGMLLGQGVALALDSIFGSESALDWAWRIAFYFGSLVGVIAYFVRRHAGETAQFAAMRSGGTIDRLPLRTLLKHSPREILAGFLLCSVHAWIVAAIYLALPAFLTKICSMTQAQADGVALTTAGAGSIIYIVSGWLADRVGVRRLCRLVLVAIGAAALPGYHLIQLHGAWPAIVLGGICGAFIGAYLGLLPRLFAAQVRVSGLAVAYDGAFAIVGGAGPLVMLWTADRWGSTGVGVLLAAFAIAGLVGLALSRRAYSLSPLEPESSANG